MESVINVNEEKKYLIKCRKSFWLRTIEILILALVILVPLAFYPFCVDIFLSPKELVAEILIVVGLMCWGLKMVSEDEFKFIHNPLDLPILSFMIICALSLLWSNNLFISLKELPLFLMGPFLYFTLTNNIQDERQIKLMLIVLLIVGSLFGIYGILQYNGIDFFFRIRNIGRQQVFGLFGNVNYFAEYLIVPLPIAISLFFSSRSKINKALLLIGILAMGGSLVVTFTQGSYLALAVSLIFIFIISLKLEGEQFIKRNKNIFILLLIIIMTVAFLFVIPNPLSKPGTVISKIRYRTSIARLSDQYSINVRIATWKYTGMMIKDHPLLGSGIGTFKYNSLSYQAKFLSQGENRSLYPYGFADKVHNEYLQLWAEIGIIGLGIFIWMIITYFSYGLKLLKRIKNNYKQGIMIGLMGSVIAVLVDGIFGFPLHLPATIVLFWLVLGLTMVGFGNEFGVQEINRKQKDSNRKERIEKDRKKQEQEEGIEKARNNKSNIRRFKPLLYIGIIILSVFLSMILVRPFIARTYWYYGNKEMKNKNWNEAIKVYEEALRWDPYIGWVYYNMGVILKINEFYGLAQEYFEKSEKYFDYPDLPQNLALVYIKRRELDKAIIKLKQAISYQKDEKSMLPWYSQLGRTYNQLGKYELAERAFQSALEIDPDFVDAYFSLAGVYLSQNRNSEALEELQKIITLYPESEEARFSEMIVQKLMKEKMKKEAEEEIEGNEVN